MSKKRKSLPRKLSVTLMLLAAPIFVVSLSTFFNHVKVLLHEEAVEHSNSILNTTLQRVVNYMAAIETAAESNAWLLEENFNPDSLQAISRHIVRLNRSLLSCSVSMEPNEFPQYGQSFSIYSAKDGDTIITVQETDYDYLERAWYRKAIQAGKPIWVDPFSDFNEGAINFNDAVGTYCIPLRPEGNRIAGVLSADFSFNRLAEIVRAAEHPFPSAYYMLLGNDGRFLIHPQSNLLFKKTIFSEVDSIQNGDVITLGKEMTSGRKGFMHVNKEGKTYHISYATVPGTQWSLALVCLDNEILSDYRHLTYLIIIVIIVGLLFMIWITARVVRRNIKPVNQLLEATQKIAEGHHDEVIPVSDRKDVVAQLQNAFAAMQQTIISHMESVNHTAEEIEKENEELELAMRQAEESAKEKRQFIRNILHQIRIPLNIIEGLTDVLLRSLSDRGKGKASKRALQTEEMNNVTSTMKSNAAHLKRMMLMLYDSSESVASDGAIYQEKDQVSCNEVARECLGHTNDNYPNAEVRFETELPDSLCILTNRLYLMRSIREMLYNAAKYSDGKHITFRVTQTEDNVQFIVEDVGPGLPKEWQDLFTQPFMKVEEMSIGLGLGLPLSKRHIASLGGHLDYDTDYQQGCRIIIEMPK